MARRLLTAGLLLAALAWCGQAVAKPPDLPLEDKDVLTPQDPLAPVESVAPSQSNPFPQDADSGAIAPQVAGDSRSEAPTMEAPFFQLRPSARRMIASCLLFGVHPLLTLTPTEDYVDFDDDDAPNRRVVELLNQSEDLRQIADEWERFWLINQPSAVEKEPTGALIFSVGVNSDAGLTGSIEVTGAFPDAMKCGEMLKAFWQLIPQPEVEERAAGFHIEQPDDDSEAPAQPEQLHVMPQETPSDLGFPINSVGGSTAFINTVPESGLYPSDDSAESVCPYVRQQKHCAARPEVPTADVLSQDVLHNLEALNQAQTLLQTARDFGRSGRVGEALNCLELAHTLCPGSRIDDAVQETAVYLFAPLYYGSASYDFGAEEESEPAAAPPKSEDGCEQCPGCGGLSLCASRSVKEREIKGKLTQPVSVDIRNVPLRDVIDDLRSWQEMNIYIDKDALDSEEVSLDHPISLRIDNISLRTTLDLILKQVHLTYVVKDEVVQITTERGARGKMQRVTYQVADLLKDDLHYPEALSETGEQSPERALTKLITTTICPQEWSDNGGPGTVDFHPLTRSLVVCAAADVQEQIADLLNALQRLNDADEEEERQGADPCEGCKKLLDDCHEAMDAGRQREAAVLAARAVALDPEQAAADPLVYKMHLAGADAEPGPSSITPCLPPVDPETPAALDQLYQESLQAAPAGGEEQEPPAAAPQSSFEFGFGLDGSVQMFGQFCRGGAIWHVIFGRDGLAVWASPDGGADPAPAVEQTSEFDWDY